ncbi:MULTISPECIES: hypothetical protein [Vibrio harveyi group]|uniref:hypothetical protein n=1 Tax=Vibrio harveyi group TaxID=717610 RepID=UPI00215BDB8E|nr:MULTISPECIES: hypothetical protein [Vibrio harveyi group]MCR9694899.1 hypothetical protein [Vibrio parahaemolyticus]MCR9764081.1 hypothetical protein [Vibrio parahaemolyticus]MCS0313521.1 hypothetical protein [Vibrio diabolicus]
MNKIFLSSLLISGFACASSGVLKDSLNSWQPLSVVKNGNDVIIALNERRVTDVIYDAVVQNGICMPSWLGKGEGYLHELNSISVVNMYEKQGYILLEPQSACKAIGEASSKNAKVLVMGNSRTF